MENIKNEGCLFDEKLSEDIKDRFYHVDYDPVHKTERIFFDNAGGALRLKTANDKFKEIDELPDCPEHSNKTAKWLFEIQEKAIEDLKIIYNVKSGSFLTSLTASMVMFDMVGSIIENVPGSNVVTTALEHPSSFDAVTSYAKKYGKEIRIAEANPVTGGIDTEEISKLVDENTCVLSVINASNISGSVIDIESVVKEARKIKPDLYIVCDAVQHMPHNAVDLKKTPVDAMNFAPYKFFGPRGFGIGYMSERASKLPHNKLIAKPVDEWELGSPAAAHFAAVTEIVDYVCWIGSKFATSSDRRELYVEGMKRINLHERALMHRMLNGSDKIEGLRDIKGVKVHLDYDDLSTRDLIMAIEFDNIDFTKAVEEYETEGIIVFERVISSLYSERMLKSLKIDGAVRVSPLHCHTVEDIDKFLIATKKIASK
ncbi:MAG: aminotransferase class V-fold PLP-dependent enzyme [Sedimentibacter sp.]|uniref:aminotransferase class V-fold PLP-dependent enzyme n=1 Tax=Sedimentibacter sp. TaxID=1960295 RepID=UPI0031587B28